MSSSTSNDCSICCEPYTKMMRKEIECFNCQKSSCSSCIKRYILDSSTEAKCLHCNIQWDRRFMVNNLTKKFCDIDYRNHRLDILHHRNKCYLPRVSEIIDIENQEKTLKNNIFLKKNEIEQLKFQIKTHPEKEERKRLREIRREKNEKLESTRMEYYRLYSLSTRRIDEFIRGENNTTSSTQNQEQVNNRPCITENCLGYLNRKGECPICNRITCLSCNLDKTKEENHSCKEEDKLQWEEIRKSTKPCPSCRVRIFKIVGCDQMWCTNCNTPFSWNRGTIENGPVHNPHYYDWLFNGGDENNRPRMNGLENLECNENVLPSIYRIRDFNNNEILDYYRILTHLKQVEVRKLEGTYGNYYRNNNPEHMYREKLLPILKNYIQNGDKKPLEQFDYRNSSNREMAHILNGYIQQQTHNFHSLVRSQNIQEFQELYNQTKNYYKGAISTFEKEYKRTYNTIHKHL